MGECGLRGGYSEILNMDPAVKSLYLKSISAKLCPTGTLIDYMNMWISWLILPYFYSIPRFRWHSPRSGTKQHLFH